MATIERGGSSYCDGTKRVTTENPRRSSHRRPSGGIDRRPSGRWRARYLGSDGHRHVAQFSTKADADAWLAAQSTDQHRGSWVDPRLGRVTLKQWADDWLSTTVHLKPKTRVGYESALRAHVLPAFGDWPIGQVDQPAVRRFLAEMTAAGAAPGTIAGTRKVLRLVLATAVGAKAILANPCDGVRVPRSARSEMQFLGHEEVEALAQAISHPAVRAAGHGATPHWRTEFPEFGLLVRLAAYSGLRAGELEALRWKSVDLLGAGVQVVETVQEVYGHGLIFGPTKTYARRRVPIPRFVIDELAGHQPRPFDPEALVFTGPDGGVLRHRNFYGRHFRPAVALAGLPEHFRFHDLRHTFAALLIAEGGHPRSIMERMGHSSITVTLNTYGHLLPSLEERLTDALDARGRAARQAPPGRDSKSVRSRGGPADVSALPERHPNTP